MFSVNFRKGYEQVCFFVIFSANLSRDLPNFELDEVFTELEREKEEL